MKKVKNRTARLRELLKGLKKEKGLFLIKEILESPAQRDPFKRRPK